MASDAVFTVGETTIKTSRSTLRFVALRFRLGLQASSTGYTSERLDMANLIDATVALADTLCELQATKANLRVIRTNRELRGSAKRILRRRKSQPHGAAQLSLLHSR